MSVEVEHEVEDVEISYTYTCCECGEDIDEEDLAHDSCAQERTCSCCGESFDCSVDLICEDCHDCAITELREKLQENLADGDSILEQLRACREVICGLIGELEEDQVKEERNAKRRRKRKRK